MSAQLQELTTFRPMHARDLDAVMAIERDVYPFPWTRGNFKDSLGAGYSCWVIEQAGSLIGYGVMMAAAEEAHLLNLSIARPWQRQGMGRTLLAHFIRLAKERGGRIMFLEVRPSNHAACRLYGSVGFKQIAVRRGYYPGADGREDAILMGLKL